MTTAFKRTELGSHATVSDQLRHARERLDLTISQCAKQIAVGAKYLQALEDSRYELLPGKLYTKAWIKKYATLLSLPVDEIVTNYERETALRKKIQSVVTVKRNIIRRWWWEWLSFRRISLILITLGVITYFSLTIYDTIRAPKVLLSIPTSGFRTQENSIIIKGLTEKGTTVRINQQSITLDSANSFTQGIMLAPGLNTVTISAEKKHSKAYWQEIPIIRTTTPEIATSTTGQ